jgi:hypothetical protein
MSDAEILKRVREVMIDAVAEVYIEKLEVMDDEELLDLYKEHVVGLIKVDGVWTNGNTL